MNKERMETLALYIEQSPIFNEGEYATTPEGAVVKVVSELYSQRGKARAGSLSIAGTAVVAFTQGAQGVHLTRTTVFQQAMAVMDLNWRQANWLFCGVFNKNEVPVTKEYALSAVRKMIERPDFTGHIDPPVLEVAP